jgi:hypothetical protein
LLKWVPCPSGLCQGFQRQLLNGAEEPLSDNRSGSRTTTRGESPSTGISVPRTAAANAAQGADDPVHLSQPGHEMLLRGLVAPAEPRTTGLRRRRPTGAGLSSARRSRISAAPPQAVRRCCRGVANWSSSRGSRRPRSTRRGPLCAGRSRSTGSTSGSGCATAPRARQHQAHPPAGTQEQRGVHRERRPRRGQVRQWHPARSAAARDRTRASPVKSW